MSFWFMQIRRMKAAQIADSHAIMTTIATRATLSHFAE
jgi:hypothetical protein